MAELGNMERGHHFRLGVTGADKGQAFVDLNRMWDAAVEKHGRGAFVSRHEIMGCLMEEYDEAKAEVHGGTLEDLGKELLQVAQVALLGYACIRAGKVSY